jgi:hypothetical protein
MPEVQAWLGIQELLQAEVGRKVLREEGLMFDTLKGL